MPDWTFTIEAIDALPNLAAVVIALIAVRSQPPDK